MFGKPLLISIMAGSLLLAFNPAFAADSPERNQVQERVYGSQLMTAQERAEYRARMRAARTAESREKIRAGHHEAMQVRAREKGLALPDEPPVRGMKSSGGTGSGMGAESGRGR